MKAIVCELCGGNELIKENGVYRCTHCNTVYTPDEAKSLFVEVSGTVNVEGVAGVQNLLDRAVSFEETLQPSKAIEYYEKVLDLDISNEEANSGLKFLKRGNVLVSFGALKNKLGPSENLVVDGFTLDVDRESVYCKLSLREGRHTFAITDSLGKVLASSGIEINASTPAAHVKLKLGTFAKGVEVSPWSQAQYDQASESNIVSNSPLLNAID